MSSDAETIVERYTHVDDKLFVSLTEAIVLSEALAVRVKESGFCPNLIVGIANGALLPATIVSESLDLPLQIVRVRRKGSLIKQKLARFAFIRNMVSFLYNLPITRPLLRVVMDQFSALDKNHSELVEDHKTYKNILVVDDAIETGQTLEYEVNTQISGKISDYKIAVISWSIHYKKIKSKLKPDFYISERIHHYPWSQNSPYLEEYSNWLQDRKIKEWE